MPFARFLTKITDDATVVLVKCHIVRSSASEQHLYVEDIVTYFLFLSINLILSQALLLLLFSWQTLLERCRVHHWSPGLPILVAFFHAEERPIFIGFKSASTACSQAWLGLPFSRFQSEKGFWVADATKRWWSSFGELQCGQRGAIFCRLWCEREAGNQRCVGLQYWSYYNDITYITYYKALLVQF